MLVLFGWVFGWVSIGFFFGCRKGCVCLEDGLFVVMEGCVNFGFYFFRCVFLRFVEIG